MGNVKASWAAACAQMEDLPRKPVAWEWLHLVAFKMGGLDHDPQAAANLVAGTYDANTEMMAVEDAVKWAVETYDIVVTLDVSAELIVGTHVAKKIDYKITIGNQSRTVKFDLFTMTTPSRGDTKKVKEWLLDLMQKAGVPTGASSTAAPMAAPGASNNSNAPTNVSSSSAVGVRNPVPPGTSSSPSPLSSSSSATSSVRRSPRF